MQQWFGRRRQCDRAHVRSGHAHPMPASTFQFRQQLLQLPVLRWRLPLSFLRLCCRLRQQQGRQLAQQGRILPCFCTWLPAFRWRVSPCCAPSCLLSHPPCCFLLRSWSTVQGSTSRCPARRRGPSKWRAWTRASSTGAMSRAKRSMAAGGRGRGTGARGAAPTSTQTGSRPVPSGAGGTWSVRCRPLCWSVRCRRPQWRYQRLA